MAKENVKRYVRRPFERVRVLKTFSKASRTKQAFKDECDINRVMKKYEKTGVITHVNRFSGRYGDFISAPDYQAACNAVLAAQDMFMTLPSKVRARFENDPRAFLEFAQNPDNVDEMRELGLLKPEVVEHVQKVHVVNEPLPKDEASAE